MNKKALISLLIITHFLCIVLGYCVASIHTKASNPIAETVDTTKSEQEEGLEQTIPSSTESSLDLVIENTEDIDPSETTETPELPSDVPTTEPSAPIPTPPVTEPPATQPPVTEPPVTLPPVTEPPATQPPVTEPPATTPPVVEPAPGGNDQLPMG